MSEVIVQPSTQTAPAGNAEVVTLSTAEFADLKHRADVSSQNFERLKKAEEDKAALEAQLLASNYVPSDTDSEQLRVLNEKIERLEMENRKADLQNRHPVLKEAWDDFESYRNDPNNKGMNLNTAAKAFLTEKGLLDPVRKGLESGTGGTHAPVKTGYTADEVKNLRENNHKEYMRLVLNGDLDNIK